VWWRGKVGADGAGRSRISSWFNSRQFLAKPDQIREDLVMKRWPFDGQRCALGGHRRAGKWHRSGRIRGAPGRFVFLPPGFRCAQPGLQHHGAPAHDARQVAVMHTLSRSSRRRSGSRIEDRKQIKGWVPAFAGTTRGFAVGRGARRRAACSVVGYKQASCAVLDIPHRSGSMAHDAFSLAWVFRALLRAAASKRTLRWSRACAIAEGSGTCGGDQKPEMLPGRYMDDL
jgi:hypothetical protein